MTPLTAACQALCPQLSPGICSNACPLSPWCYLTISSLPATFSFCFQSFLVSGSFPMSLRLSSLLILISICGPFNLDLDGFLAALLLISKCSALWKLEVIRVESCLQGMGDKKPSPQTLLEFTFILFWNSPNLRHVPCLLRYVSVIFIIAMKLEKDSYYCYFYEWYNWIISKYHLLQSSP